MIRQHVRQSVRRDRHPTRTEDNLSAAESLLTGAVNDPTEQHLHRQHLTCFHDDDNDSNNAHRVNVRIGPQLVAQTCTCSFVKLNTKTYAFVPLLSFTLKYIERPRFEMQEKLQILLTMLCISMLPLTGCRPVHRIVKKQIAYLDPISIS